MRRVALLLLVAVFVGCKGTTGPLASRQREQKPDPLYNSEEQQRFVRERYPYIEQDNKVAPRTFNEPYGRDGR